MPLRSSTRLCVIALALAGSLGPAAAQTYSSAPLPPPDTSAPAASYYRNATAAPPCDPCHEQTPAPMGGPFVPYPGRFSSNSNDDLAPQPMPDLGGGPLRPPGSIGNGPDATGSVRPSAGAPPMPTVSHGS